ncbi:MULTISPECIES: pyridoxine 5'-phosphate synthase [unclassified Saccharibacter]|uniref:pyridoxine 5'-phosphate synthase n=1 Tax=unclassified Saccharibacter TaxID=2648722 RepID=UPI0013236A3F|nr:MULTISPECIES: pyridoxine 5'-phosphate synthase [unclassified Saccharibacter]MXV35922.1 pyridoxine 5'-phosphate synthase [Saccharibacter sp. EH611]MXV58042.1 pyridoxine 5'-phosphate synthase [Saccharibacter sp. EH70]MXV66280.1 pyridoxine 5'-phosphate synthase [Saccharibacter sp. EH60]
MIRLGLNVDHVATLRNARGEAYPDPVDAARIALDHGADGITAHLREDRRHIRDADIERLRKLPAPLNFEMAATDEMVDIACRVKPHACCLVPERRQEVTTEGGLAVVAQEVELQAKVARLLDAGIRVSLFIDPEPAAIEAAQRLGAPVVELHTGAYALGGSEELARLQKAAECVAQCGIELHAGHGLTYDNVGPITRLPHLAELNIGHFLISEAVFSGIGPAVRSMKNLLSR